MQFVADLEPNSDGGLQIMYGIDGRRDLTETLREELSGYEGAQPVRLGNGAFDQRQNDVFGAVLDSILVAHPAQQAPAPAVVAPRGVAGSGRDRGLARAGPGDLGGTWKAPALRVVQADVLGRARPRGQAGRDPRRQQAPGGVGRSRGRDQGRHPRARRQRPRGPPPALRHRCPGRLDPAGPAVRLPAGQRRADPQHRHLHRRGADRERVRPALPHRRDRRRPVRQGGHVLDLLLLAGVRLRRDRRHGSGRTA